MNIHDLKDFINTSGFPIVLSLALIFFIWKLWQDQKSTLNEITNTNKELVDTNRNLVEKLVDKVDTIDDKVDNIKETLEDKIDDIKHLIR